MNSKKLFHQILNPLFLALTLNIIVAIFALTLGDASKVLDGWFKGFHSLMGFAMQMILMLALGHAVATAPLSLNGINKLANWIAKKQTPAFWLTILSAGFAWLHWGLGLVAGAILARSVAMSKGGHLIRYTAAAYAGFIVWHGGWSGSAPLLVATKGHFLEKQIGVIPVGQTILSSLNLTIFSITVLIAALTITFWPIQHDENLEDINLQPSTAKQDKEPPFGLLIGMLLLVLIFIALNLNILKIDLSFIITLLFALAILLHVQLSRFTNAVKEGMDGTVGIAIQFPLYGAIMGMMKSTGLAVLIAKGFISSIPPIFFPGAVFLSAGFLNLVVPSGGGQWIVQGGIIMEAASQLGQSIPNTLIAFAWGDAWTNLIQPFWALPLLAITQVKAQRLLPVTFWLCITTGLTITTILTIWSLV